MYRMEDEENRNSGESDGPSCQGIGEKTSLLRCSSVSQSERVSGKERGPRDFNQVQRLTGSVWTLVSLVRCAWVSSGQYYDSGVKMHLRGNGNNPRSPPSCRFST